MSKKEKKPLKIEEDTYIGRDLAEPAVELYYMFTRLLRFRSNQHAEYLWFIEHSFQKMDAYRKMLGIQGITSAEQKSISDLELLVTKSREEKPEKYLPEQKYLDYTQTLQNINISPKNDSKRSNLIISYLENCFFEMLFFNEIYKKYRVERIQFDEAVILKPCLSLYKGFIEKRQDKIILRIKKSEHDLIKKDYTNKFLINCYYLNIIYLLNTINYERCPITTDFLITCFTENNLDLTAKQSKLYLMMLFKLNAQNLEEDQKKSPLIKDAKVFRLFIGKAEKLLEERIKKIMNKPFSAKSSAILSDAEKTARKLFVEMIRSEYQFYLEMEKLHKIFQLWITEVTAVPPSIQIDKTEKKELIGKIQIITIKYFVIRVQDQLTYYRDQDAEQFDLYKSSPDLLIESKTIKSGIRKICDEIQITVPNFREFDQQTQFLENDSKNKKVAAPAAAPPCPAPAEPVAAAIGIESKKTRETQEIEARIRQCLASYKHKRFGTQMITTSNFEKILKQVIDGLHSDSKTEFSCVEDALYRMADIWPKNDAKESDEEDDEEEEDDDDDNETDRIYFKIHCYEFLLEQKSPGYPKAGEIAFNLANHYSGAKVYDRKKEFATDSSKVWYFLEIAYQLRYQKMADLIENVRKQPLPARADCNPTYQFNNLKLSRAQFNDKFPPFPSQQEVVKPIAPVDSKTALSASVITVASAAPTPPLAPIAPKVSILKREQTRIEILREQIQEAKVKLEADKAKLESDKRKTESLHAQLQASQAKKAQEVALLRQFDENILSARKFIGSQGYRSSFSFWSRQLNPRLDAPARQDYTERVHINALLD